MIKKLMTKITGLTEIKPKDKIYTTEMLEYIEQNKLMDRYSVLKGLKVEELESHNKYKVHDKVYSILESNMHIQQLPFHDELSFGVDEHLKLDVVLNNPNERYLLSVDLKNYIEPELDISMLLPEELFSEVWGENGKYRNLLLELVYKIRNKLFNILAKMFSEMFLSEVERKQLLELFNNNNPRYYTCNFKYGFDIAFVSKNDNLRFPVLPEKLYFSKFPTRREFKEFTEDILQIIQQKNQNINRQLVRYA